ncbi:MULTISPECIES: efflux RND transporter periplasmic adaptor subunit [unclassified Synechococcus]|uniref:efflux RND transporter periplasmic adaptor subunit n=1 Tax=unclassified Synechococcus TaxID=2626047 RepID=UPI00202946D1|nr:MULTISPECIES: efflux RND transporter periplasmic adaptor subunit [unclassified Synechococcus]
MIHRIVQGSASALVASAALLLTAPAWSHVGHGDEFQQQGDVRQVKANTETDALLGVTATQPQQGPEGLSVPTAAVVQADGKPLVFVKTATTYDPVFVQTGPTLGDQIVITEGLDPTDDVVVNGALSLYAESKKTQQAEPSAAEASADRPADQPEGNSALIAGGVAAALVVAAGATLTLRRKQQGE